MAALRGGDGTLIRVAETLSRFFRAVILIQAVGGAVGLVLGAVTLQGTRVTLGLFQLMLAGAVLGIQGRERLSTVDGPGGAYVVRAGPRAVWRDERGWRRLAPMVSGRRSWTVTARRREDDPFGPVVLRRQAPDEAALTGVLAEVEGALRRGDGARPS